jgi:uncharacterized protein (DUF2461 family)
MEFTGFPAGAMAWFQSTLGERDWSRVAARSAEHEASVRAPMSALCAALAGEFGPAHVWHLHRDPRLWSHQVATVAVADNVGLRVQLSLDALQVAGEWRTSSPDQIARYRAAVLGSAGDRLAGITADLRAAGFELTGDRLARPPSGTARDHPHADLARHRTLVVAREWPAGGWLATAEPLRRVRRAWCALDPLMDWFAGYVGPRQRS